MKKNLIIDLTALLDIILIILFLVVTSANEQVDERQEKMEELQLQQENIQAERSQWEEEQEQLQAQISELQEKLAAAETVNELDAKDLAQYEAFLYQIKKVDIEYRISEEQRSIVLTPDDKVGKEIVIQHSDDRRGKAREISEMIQYFCSPSDEMILITFRYDNRQIYRYEYQIVEDAIDLLREDCVIVYSEKGNL